MRKSRLGTRVVVLTIAAAALVVALTVVHELVRSPSRGKAVVASVTLPALTAKQMAGQRVIYSYKGLTPPASLLSLISHGEAAGVIFFGDNISSDAQIRAVIATLEHANASPQNPVRAPLLLMTDQEGGQGPPPARARRSSPRSRSASRPTPRPRRPRPAQAPGAT